MIPWELLKKKKKTSLKGDGLKKVIQQATTKSFKQSSFYKQNCINTKIREVSVTRMEDCNTSGANTKHNMMWYKPVMRGITQPFNMISTMQ